MSKKTATTTTTTTQAPALSPELLAQIMGLINAQGSKAPEAPKPEAPKAPEAQKGLSPEQAGSTMVRLIGTVGQTGEMVEALKTFTDSKPEMQGLGLEKTIKKAKELYPESEAWKEAHRAFKGSSKDTKKKLADAWTYAKKTQKGSTGLVGLGLLAGLIEKACKPEARKEWGSKPEHAEALQKLQTGLPILMEALKGIKVQKPKPEPKAPKAPAKKTAKK